MTKKYYGPDKQAAPVDEYGYNLPGRLVSFLPDGGSKITFGYDPSGIRTSKTAGGVTTNYVVDHQNPTGYAQVLEESEIDITNPQLPVLNTVTYYTLGDDVIAQTKAGDFGSGWEVADTQYLLYDGHGSTRQLLNSDLTVADSYNYDGYGVMLSDNSRPEATAQTTHLYAGEQYDANADNYYLRARYLNHRNGTFNRMDDFFGNLQDPQSLHKYLYVHSNPINCYDYSGYSTIQEVMVDVALTAMFTMNFFSAVVNAKGVLFSTISLINAWSSGDFWNGLAYVILGIVHGIGMVMSIVGMLSGISGPPPGMASLLASSSGQIWTKVFASPAVAGWVVEQVAPAAFTAFLVFAAKRSGVDYENVAENHHKVPHSNSTYRHEDHQLMKQAGWDNDDLINIPENQMKLYNHHGRHWNQYHQEIKRMMDEALPNVENKGQGAARDALRKIFDEIEVKIKSGELKPYGGKEVW